MARFPKWKTIYPESLVTFIAIASRFNVARKTQQCVVKMPSTIGWKTADNSILTKINRKESVSRHNKLITRVFIHTVNAMRAIIVVIVARLMDNRASVFSRTHDKCIQVILLHKLTMILGRNGKCHSVFSFLIE